MPKSDRFELRHNEAQGWERGGLRDDRHDGGAG